MKVNDLPIAGYFPSNSPLSQSSRSSESDNEEEKGIVEEMQKIIDSIKAVSLADSRVSSKLLASTNSSSSSSNSSNRGVAESQLIVQSREILRTITSATTNMRQNQNISPARSTGYSDTRTDLPLKKSQSKLNQSTNSCQTLTAKQSMLMKSNANNQSDNPKDKSTSPYQRTGGNKPITPSSMCSRTSLTLPKKDWYTSTKTPPSKVTPTNRTPPRILERSKSPFDKSSRCTGKLYDDSKYRRFEVQRKQQEEVRISASLSECTFTPKKFSKDLANVHSKIFQVKENEIIREHRILPANSLVKGFDSSVLRVREGTEKTQRLSVERNKIRRGSLYEKNKKMQFNPPSMLARKKPFYKATLTLRDGSTKKISLTEDDDPLVKCQQISVECGLDFNEQSILEQTLVYEFKAHILALIEKTTSLSYCSEKTPPTNTLPFRP